MNPNLQNAGSISQFDAIQKAKDHLPKVAAVVSAVTLAKPYVENIKTRWKTNRTYSIRVSETDPLFDRLVDWVESLAQPQAKRTLVASSPKNEQVWSEVDSEWRTIKGGAVVYRFPPATTQKFILDGGHEVMAWIQTADRPSSKEGDSMQSFFVKPDELIFQVESRAGRDAVQKEIDNIHSRSVTTEKKAALRLATSWGSWRRHDELTKRTLESVILPGNQMEDVVNDMQRFLDSEEDYVRRSLPWHRGYLFEGPPGTGKTSAAVALANHFKMDVWVLPLSDIGNDSGLMNLVNAVSPRSVLLLEDIDVFRASKERTEGDKGGKVTLAGLLNSLDGLSTPHGLVTLMTTNDMTALDSALIRPGRIDRIEHFGLADADQTLRLWQWFYQTDDLVIVPSGLAPSDIIGAFYPYLEDKDAGLNALWGLKCES